MPDQPFIDTLKLLMKRQGILVHNSLNVIIPCQRNADNTLPFRLDHRPILRIIRTLDGM